MIIPILGGGATPPVPDPGAKWILLQVGADGALKYSTNLRTPDNAPATPQIIAGAIRTAADAIANERGGLIL